MSLVLYPVPQRSVVMPSPPSVAEFQAGTANWQPSSVTEGNWGRLQVVIGNTDVTFFRGAPCTVESWGSQEPFGDDQAVIDFPSVFLFDTLGGTGSSVPWAYGGADALINVVYANGTTKPLFAGFVQALTPYYPSQSGSGTSTTNGSAHYLQVTLMGTMFQAQLAQLTPYFAVNLEKSNGVVDAGILITEALNQVIGRRWGLCKQVLTSFPLAINGSFINVLEYVQDVLGQMLSIDGTTQYTISCSPTDLTPVLQLKDVSTINWTIDAGAPGIDLSGLTDDETLNTNVLYGSGTTPQGVQTPFNLVLCGVASEFSPGGEVWINSKFPAFNPSTGTPYPFSSAGSVITIGTSDNAPGMTINPNGVSTLQGALTSYGGGPVTGTYNSQDAQAVEAIQAANGIQVDGVVGPQTWEAIFNVASNTGGSAQCFPLYALPQVQPYLYNGYGAKTGNNPDYNPNILRVESYTGMGAGITLKQAEQTAKSVVLRDYQGSWAGTIVLTTDPHEGSRFEIRAGQNIMVNYFFGTNLLFHINQVDVAFDTAPSIGTGAPTEQPTLQVTLTVDTAARDAITSKNMVAHEPGSPGDPVRRANTLKRSSRLTKDTTVPFDSQSGAGIVPIHAIYTKLWTVLQIPFGGTGSIGRVRYATSSSPSIWTSGRTGYPFYLAIFNQSITATQLISILGNNGDPTIQGTWQTNAAALKQAGLVNEWGGYATGQALQPCGYYPSTLQQGGAVTGDYLDDDVWTYSSTQPPWLWVCEWSPNACYIQGCFEQAVAGTAT